jgi:hypothetical protein
MSSKMSDKVLPSKKVSIPAGHGLGSFPQTTPKNPSQANRNNPPTIPPVQRGLGEPAPFRPDTSRPF